MAREPVFEAYRDFGFELETESPDFATLQPAERLPQRSFDGRER